MCSIGSPRPPRVLNSSHLKMLYISKMSLGAYGLSAMSYGESGTEKVADWSPVGPQLSLR